MQLRHVIVQLWPATGRWFIPDPVTVNRRGPMPSCLAPFGWSRVVRVPAGWDYAAFPDCEAEMYAAAKRYAMRRFPDERDAIWDILSPRVISAALELGNQRALRLLCHDFLGIDATWIAEFGYERADLAGDLFLWHSEWQKRLVAGRQPSTSTVKRHDATERVDIDLIEPWMDPEIAAKARAAIAAEFSRIRWKRRRQNTFYAFAQNKLRTLEQRELLKNAREIPMSDYIEPAEHMGKWIEAIDHDEPDAGHREITGMFSNQPTVHREMLDSGHLIFAHRPVFERPPLAVPVIEAPIYDPMAGRSVIAYDHSPKESQWLLVSQNDLTPGRRRKAMLREAPATFREGRRGTPVSTIATASVDDGVLRPERLSRKARGALLIAVMKNIPLVASRLDVDLESWSGLSMGRPWRREDWYRSLRPIERRYANRLIQRLFDISR